MSIDKILRTIINHKEIKILIGYWDYLGFPKLQCQPMWDNATLKHDGLSKLLIKYAICMKYIVKVRHIMSL